MEEMVMKMNRAIPFLLLVSMCFAGIALAADLSLNFKIDNLDALKTGTEFAELAVSGENCSFPDRTQLRLGVTTSYPAISGREGEMTRAVNLVSKSITATSPAFTQAVKVASGGNEAAVPGWFTVELRFDARQSRLVKDQLGDGFQDITTSREIWVGRFDEAFKMMNDEFRELMTAPDKLTDINKKFLALYTEFRKTFKPIDPANPPGEEERVKIMEQLASFQKSVGEIQEPMSSLNATTFTKRKAGMMREGYNALSGMVSRASSQTMSVGNLMRGAGSELPTADTLDATYWIISGKADLSRSAMLTLGYLLQSTAKELPGRYTSSNKTTLDTEWSAAMASADSLWADFKNQFSKSVVDKMKTDAGAATLPEGLENLKKDLVTYLDGMNGNDGPVKTCEALLEAVRKMQTDCAAGNADKALKDLPKVNELFNKLHKQVFYVLG